MAAVRWFEQEARHDLTLHAEGCRHLKPSARPSRWEPSLRGQVVEDPPLQPRRVWTCRLCLERVRLLAAAWVTVPEDDALA